MWREGEAVTAGQRLMVLEAMKMEHALTAPFDGTVSGLAVSAGSQVQVEAVLCTVEAAGGSVILPGTGRGTAAAGGGGGAHADGVTPPGLARPRVPLHQPAGGPPPPLGEELA